MSSGFDTEVLSQKYPSIFLIMKQQNLYMFHSYKR